MTKDDLEELGADLYREFLIDHYKNPRNAGLLEPADFRRDEENPACGDMITVTGLVGDGRLRDVRFKGKGCAISQAATSILLEDVKGKPFSEILKIERKDVEELLGITLRPARVKCGELGLLTLKAGIRDVQSRTAAKKPVPGFGARR